jgi:hypothetical protein
MEVAYARGDDSKIKELNHDEFCPIYRSVFDDQEITIEGSLANAYDKIRNNLGERKFMEQTYAKQPEKWKTILKKYQSEYKTLYKEIKEKQKNIRRLYGKLIEWKTKINDNEAFSTNNKAFTSYATKFIDLYDKCFVSGENSVPESLASLFDNARNNLVHYASCKKTLNVGKEITELTDYNKREEIQNDSTAALQKFEENIKKIQEKLSLIGISYSANTPVN